MSVGDALGGLVHPGQVLLRGVVLLGSAAAVLAAKPVGTVPTWVEVGVGLLALVAVARPGSMAGLALLLLVGELWLTQDAGSAGSPWLLVAVAGVVITHLGLLVAAQGPASVAPDARQLVVWTGRGAALWAAAAVVWAGARLLADTPAPSTVVVAALGLLLAATVGTGRWVSRRS